MKRTLVRLGLLGLVTSALVACSGGSSDGINGAPGAPGVQGPAGGGISLAALSSDQWADLKLQGQVTQVTINSPPEVTFTLTDISGNPIVGLENNTTTSSSTGLTSYANLAMSIAKLVPSTGGSPSKWVSYIVTSTSNAPSRPSTDNTGTLTYNGNGTYTYRFARDIKTIKATVDASTDTATNKKADLGDLTYDPSLTHRVAIQISGDARGTGRNTADGVTVAPSVLLKDPINIIYDFVPATGQAVTAANSQREIASVKSCFECHTKFVGFHGSNPELGLAGIGASRQDTRMCVVCHTDQRKFGRKESTATDTTITPAAGDTSTYRLNGKSLTDFPTFVHKIHMGEELVKTGYNIAGLAANEVKFPQLITNCTKCHDNSATAVNPTAQGDNWKTVPNRAACGACHDGIDFATGLGTNLDRSTTGHGKGGGLGGAQPDDSQCRSCHAPDDIKLVHVSVTPIDPNNTLAGGTNNNTNAAAIASNLDNLPAGAIKVSYEIKSVTRDATTKQPSMVFRLLLDGVPAVFNAPPAAGTPDATLSDLEMLPGFMGSPSAYFVFAVPQDGVTTPADFNATTSGYLRSIWNGKATGTGVGTLTGPDATGFYTVTLTGVTIPDSAVMLTGGLGYTYNVKSTLPLTQTNLPAYPVADSLAAGLTAFMPNKTGGLIVVAPDTQKVATGYTGRRVIVEDARCNKCHRELGVFNESSFHSGQRNDATTCSWCHTPNRTSKGWSADSTNFIHSIHAAGKRGDSAKFTWHATEPDPVGNPGVFDGFWKIGFPGVLSNCEGCHVPGSYDFSNSTNRAAADNRLYRTVATGTFASTASALDLFTFSPYVQLDNNYGSGFSFNTATGTLNAEAAATTLVSSPTATVCFACHTTALARSHMESFGGSIYEARATALGKTEQCLICHDSGRIADLRLVHSK